MTTAPRRPVMADVAGLAGVWIMTVSRVLNGHPHVTSETREVSSALSLNSATHRTWQPGRWRAGALTDRCDERAARDIGVIPHRLRVRGGGAGRRPARQLQDRTGPVGVRDARGDRRTARRQCGGHHRGGQVARRGRGAVRLDLPVPLLATYPTADLLLSVGVDQELDLDWPRAPPRSRNERVIHVRDRRVGSTPMTAPAAGARNFDQQGDRAHDQR